MLLALFADGALFATLMPDIDAVCHYAAMRASRVRG